VVVVILVYVVALDVFTVSFFREPSQNLGTKVYLHTVFMTTR